jgi:inward rectifier potassium channel
MTRRVDEPNPIPEDTRTLRRDGSYNIERRGMPRRRLTQDLYVHLLTLQWRWLITYIAVYYAAANALFALAYLGFGDAISNARHGSFEDAFFFSVQTMATIGYGTMVPHGFVGNLLVTVESLLGLAMVAVLTGLVFAKFSRPTSRVVFSRVAVVTKQNGIPTLMFRCANERSSIIVEARMRVVVMLTEKTAEGHVSRRFHDLALTRGETPIFPLSWSVSHPIDEKSPLYGLSAAACSAEDVEIICALAGTEESIDQVIRARYSYTSEDFRWGHRFVDIISVGPGAKRILDYTHFHDTLPDEPAADPIVT